MRVGASSSKAVVATVVEVAVGEADIRVDEDGVQVSPCLPALETEQACVMRWGVACDRVGRATRTSRVILSADTEMSEGSGSRARGSAGRRAGWLWQRERQRDAQVISDVRPKLKASMA
jgi:hypothetical protein